MPEITTEMKLKAIGRELGIRRTVYPKWVKAGRMSLEQADEEIAAMDAIYADYKKRLEEEKA